MTETEFEVSKWMLHSGDKLKQALKENPDLPVIFQCSTESEYDNYVTDDADVYVGEVLTVEGPDDEKIYFERDDLEADIENSLDGEETENLPDTEFEALVESMAAEYDKYWMKTIIVYLRG